MFLDRIRRITRDGRWIPEIDGLRLLAISVVFLFHLSGELEFRSGTHIPPEPHLAAITQLLHNGDRGVSLFFVLSGLILAMPFARHVFAGAKPVSLRKFYLRRLTRLEPPYLASLCLIIPLVIIYNRGIPPGYLPHALGTLFYLHTQTFNAMSNVNAVTWSLEVEIQFYLLAPILMLLFRIRPTILRRAIFLALIVTAGILQPPYQRIYRFEASLAYYLQFFLAGMLLADIFELETAHLKPSRLWDLVGLLALAAIFWPAPSPLIHALLPFPMAALILAAFYGRILQRIASAPWAAVLGGMCYSIYLLHFIFIAIFFKVTRHFIIPQLGFYPNYLVQCIALGIPVFVVCLAFYLLIERPCMDPDWPSHLWHRLTGRRAAEARTLDSAGISD